MKLLFTFVLVSVLALCTPTVSAHRPFRRMCRGMCRPKIAGRTPRCRPGCTMSNCTVTRFTSSVTGYKCTGTPTIPKVCNAKCRPLRRRHQRHRGRGRGRGPSGGRGGWRGWGRWGGWRRGRGGRGWIGRGGRGRRGRRCLPGCTWTACNATVGNSTTVPGFKCMGTPNIKKMPMPNKKKCANKCVASGPWKLQQCRKAGCMVKWCGVKMFRCAPKMWTEVGEKASFRNWAWEVVDCLFVGGDYHYHWYHAVIPSVPPPIKYHLNE